MLLTIEPTRLLLQAKMTPELARAMQRIEGHRRWLKSGELSIENTAHNLTALQEALPTLTINTPVAPPTADEAELKAFGGDLPTYQPLTQPYAHQLRAIEKISNKPTFGLFMEQGTGKTKVIIDLACQRYLAGKITALLVVAPKGVHRQWAESQLPMHCGIDYVAGVWPLKELPKELSSSNMLAVLCINIDGAKTPKGFKICSDFIQSHKSRVLFVLDEAHKIKNRQSQAWKKMNMLGQLAKQRIALTGTPIAKELLDEWAILNWVDQRIIGIRYVSAFRNEYCIMGGWQNKEVIAYRNVEAFKKKVEPYTFRATKEEIGILPKAYETLEFKLTTYQKRLIKKLKGALIAQLESGEIYATNMVLPALLWIQQVSNGFLQEGKNIKPLFENPLENPRLQAAIEWSESYEGKLVIWARFQEDIRQLDKVIPDSVTYFGETNSKQRGIALESFLSNEGARVFISTPAAGGTGLNLQGSGCSRVLYYSNSDNSIERWQSEDRTHRIGCKGIITYTDLVAVGSLDRKILRNLANKRSISDMALSEVKEWLNAVD